MKNILVLSAGRRVDLVQAFQQEIKKINPVLKVFTTDLKPELSSACQVADGFFQVSRVTSDSYIDELLKICAENSIGMLVPTIDTELIPLSKNRHRFAEKGIHLIVSDSSLMDQCRDKRKTNELFQSLDLQAPEIYNKSSLKFPCFIKPYDGSCSVGVLKALVPEDIPAHVSEDPKMMFMQYIDHKLFKEYTIDLYYDRASELKCVVPRKRIEVRGGEVSKGVTRKNALYSYLLRRMQKLPGAIGCITLQVFFNEDSNEIYGIEINPRFGGGYPLSYSAGANFPGWLIREYFQNEKIEFTEEWQENLLMLRYDGKVLVSDYV